MGRNGTAWLIVNKLRVQCDTGEGVVVRLYALCVTKDYEHAIRALLIRELEHFIVGMHLLNNHHPHVITGICLFH